MDAQLRTAYAEKPVGLRRRGGAEDRIRQLIRRHKEELAALNMHADYLQRVAVMLMPHAPKQIVARILQDAKGENSNARSRY